jgi:hypothetical protein
MLLELPSDMNSMAKTPAAAHLRNINPDGKKLPEDRAQPFHHLIVKLLYLLMCTRQDIQTVVAFLSTRFKNQMRTTTRHKNLCSALGAQENLH